VKGPRCEIVRDNGTLIKYRQTVLTRVVKTYGAGWGGGGAELELHPFLISALDGGVRSATPG